MKYFIAALSTAALSFAFAGTADAQSWHRGRIVYRPAPVVVAPAVCAPVVVPAPIVEVYRPPVRVVYLHGHHHR